MRRKGEQDREQLVREQVRITAAAADAGEVKSARSWGWATAKVRADADSGGKDRTRPDGRKLLEPGFVALGGVAAQVDAVVAPKTVVTEDGLVAAPGSRPRPAPPPAARVHRAEAPAPNMPPGRERMVPEDQNMGRIFARDKDKDKAHDAQGRPRQSQVALVHLNACIHARTHVQADQPQ